MRKYTPLPLVIIFSFLLDIVSVHAALPLTVGEILLPQPGTIVGRSPSFYPPSLRGIKIHPNDPFGFDFIMDEGDQANSASSEQLKAQANKLIKYFLAGVTTPSKDLWVNLSPYEKNRISVDSFGQTEMGRDLLAQDYILKQLTSSLFYPEDETGKHFWQKVYSQAYQKYGRTDIKVNTFNKVWIVPNKAVVYENSKTGSAYVVDASLKVLLEQDYLAFKVNKAPPADDISTSVIRELILPQLNREVNTGKNFAPVRQVYHSLILATWYKNKLKSSIFNQAYANQNKIEGIQSDDAAIKEKIYHQYLQAFKIGAYNYIKEEDDPLTNKKVVHKYFSGGMGFDKINQAMVVVKDPALLEGFKKGLKRVVVTMALLPFVGSMPLTAMAQEEPSTVTAQVQPVNIQTNIPQAVSAGVSNQTSKEGKAVLYGTFSVSPAIYKRLTDNLFGQVNPQEARSAIDKDLENLTTYLRAHDRLIIDLRLKIQAAGPLDSVGIEGHLIPESRRKGLDPKNFFERILSVKKDIDEAVDRLFLDMPDKNDARKEKLLKVLTNPMEYLLLQVANNSGLIPGFDLRKIELIPLEKDPSRLLVVPGAEKNLKESLLMMQVLLRDKIIEQKDLLFVNDMNNRQIDFDANESNYKEKTAYIVSRIQQAEGKLYDDGMKKVLINAANAIFGQMKLVRDAEQLRVEEGLFAETLPLVRNGRKIFIAITDENRKIAKKLFAQTRYTTEDYPLDLARFTSPSGSVAAATTPEQNSQDQAMNSYGGIDLDRIDVDTQGKGGSINLKIDPAMIQKSYSSIGATPTILQIVPLNNLREFLN